MSVLEKRLLRFLLVVELFKDAGQWREERRHLQRVQNLTIRMKNPIMPDYGSAADFDPSTD
jgi:hypothetical protein